MVDLLPVSSASVAVAVVANPGLPVAPGGGGGAAVAAEGGAGAAAAAAGTAAG